MLSTAVEASMATKTITSQIVDENNQGISGLNVVAFDLGSLFGEAVLSRGTTTISGNFSLTYDDQSDGFLPISADYIVVRIYNAKGRKLQEWPLETMHTPVIIPRSYLSGWLVTMGEQEIRGLSHGNSVKILIDNFEGWKDLSQAFKIRAIQTIHLQPFGFSVPKFNTNQTQQVPNLISDFDANSFNTAPVKGSRPEDELYQAGQRGLDVRLAMHEFTFIIPDDYDEVKTYFEHAWNNGNKNPPAKPVSVRRFEMFSPTHCKLAIIDPNNSASAQAFLLGSPLIQEYYDDNSHKVDDSRRGPSGTIRVPIHDVSARLRGPTVSDINKAFLLHWNESREANPRVPVSSPLASPPPTEDEQGNMSVQIVRTLCEGRFKDNDPLNPVLARGEAGIMEAYLRAIESAENFIYLENQYFVNREIVEALIRRLKEKPNLRLVIVLNIHPDVPSYAELALSGVLPIPILIGLLGLFFDVVFEGKQQNLIEKILDALTPAIYENQVGIYTLWSHQAAESINSKPRIIPNYIHSKCAIVDDKWATVGSGNLDDYSLSPTTNSEVNALIFENFATPPPGENFETPSTSAFITNFRKKLWGEHLGTHLGNELDASPGKDWLQIWKEKAERKGRGLINSPNSVDPARVLRFPHDGTNVPLFVYKPEDYLFHLGIKTDSFLIMRNEKVYSFEENKWM